MLSTEELMLLNCGVGEDLSPLDCKSKPVSPKGKQSWITHWKDWCWSQNSNTLATLCEELTLEKTLMLGKMEGRSSRGQQDEMVGWHHWLDGHEFEQAPGVGDGQGSLACCNPWGYRIRHDWATELNCQACVLVVSYNPHYNPLIILIQFRMSVC